MYALVDPVHDIQVLGYEFYRENQTFHTFISVAKHMESLRLKWF